MSIGFCEVGGASRIFRERAQNDNGGLPNKIDKCTNDWHD